jgi:hypothetical protein
MRLEGAARLCVAMFALALVGCAWQQDGREPGWIALIDGGAGLENWRRIGDANWRVEDGAVAADRGNGYLVTRASYRDVQVRAQFWASADANSGIFLRVQDPKEITPKSSYEVNIFDRRPDPSYGTGAIVGFAQVVPMPIAGGKWNTYDITIRGARIVVILNGTKTVDIEDRSFASGPIALQAAGGTIRWRKVEVRPL